MAKSAEDDSKPLEGQFECPRPPNGKSEEEQKRKRIYECIVECFRNEGYDVLQGRVIVTKIRPIPTKKR